LCAKWQCFVSRFRFSRFYTKLTWFEVFR
jgi:hypothetical protein